MARTFTERQREAIDLRGGSIPVSASAGSGKTTVMIERVLSLLREGASLSEIVICTFTRSAAADMKDKLQNALVKESETDPRAEAQLALLPTAEVGTLHSWFLKLVRKYFYVLDVDPAFELCDEEETDLMLREAVDELIAEKSESGDGEFTELYDALLTRRSDMRLRKLLERIYKFARSQADPERWINEGAFVFSADPERAENAIYYEIDRVYARFLPLAYSLCDRTAAAGFTRNLPAVEAFVDMLEGGDAEQISPRGPIPPGMKELADEFNALKKRVADAEKPLRSAFALPTGGGARFGEQLLRLTRELDKKYSELKKARVRLDYGDLEHFACVLAGDETIRREIAQSCKYVFVDEYQDVNPLQERAVSAFSSGNLFLVGDVKQSIYAFRLCDPRIFLDKCDRAEQLGYLKCVKLNHNFRSAGKIIDFINDVFDVTMTRDFGMVDYAGEARLIAGGDPGEGDIRLHLVHHPGGSAVRGKLYSVEGDDGSEGGTAAGAMADLITRHIVELLAKGKVPAGRGEDGEWIYRPVKYSDIAVLAAARGAVLGGVYDRLRRLGIPAALSDEIELTSVREISEAVEFLKYLADDTDAIALTASLRSPIGGFTDAELAEIKASDRTEKRFEKVCAAFALSDCPTARKLNTFYEFSEKYRIFMRTHTAGEVLGKLTAEKNWFPLALSGDAPDVRADALNAFLERVNSSPYGGSVGEYVRSLETASPKAARPPAPEAVTLSTIHASKGLEYRYVFLADVSHGFNLRELNEPVVLGRDVGLCTRNFNLVSRTVTHTLQSYAANLVQRRQLIEERMRLLYVALTRAQLGLYIYAAAGDKEPLLTGEEIFPDPEGARCFFDWLRPAYQKYGFELTESADCAISFESRLPRSACEVSPDDERVVRLKEYFASPPTGHAIVKSSVTRLREDLADSDEPGECETFIAGENDDRAAVRGTAYHKFMELVDYNADFGAEWERIKPLLGEAAELVNVGELKKAAEFFGALTAGKRFYREKPFIYNPGGMLVQGVVDLLIEESPGNFLVIDYKTSKESTILSGAYDLQLSVYAAAAEEILGVRVSRAAVYSFSAGKLFDITRVPIPGRS